MVYLNVYTGVTDGDFQYVFSSPETVLKPHWKNVVLSKTWQTRMKLLVIDEALYFRVGDNFRQDYQQLSE
jgi:superfamily II DNA helicase RecQ